MALQKYACISQEVKSINKINRIQYLDIQYILTSFNSLRTTIICKLMTQLQKKEYVKREKGKVYNGLKEILCIVN